MNRSPAQRVHIREVQTRPEKASPYIVRWTVDGEPHSRSFKTKTLARRRVRDLENARDAGEPFDPITGDPASWNPSGADIAVYDWARDWLAERWAELAPRTRATTCQALARFVPLVVSEKAPERPPDMLAWLAANLAPDTQIDPEDERERWLRKWGLTLGDLDRVRLAKVDRDLGFGVKGQRLAARSSRQYRRASRSCIRRAVELGHIPEDPWPPADRGRSRRKANRVSQEVNIRRLPDPETTMQLLRALPGRTHPWAGRTWQIMSAVAYYAGLRPSEVMMIRRRSVHLPHLPGGGWGLIEVSEADDGEGRPAEPKTGYRSVPIPPALVGVLWDFLLERPGGPDDLLFRTRKGTQPDISTWFRSLGRACRIVGVESISPYDLRHACATTWLQGGVPLGEVAHRLGHSVQTLVAHYVQALKGDELTANRRIEEALGSSVPVLSPQFNLNGSKQAE